MPTATPVPPRAIVDVEMADTSASSPPASAAGPTEARPMPLGALAGLSLVDGAAASVAPPGLAEENVPGEAPRQVAGALVPPTLARVVASI